MDWYYIVLIVIGALLLLAGLIALLFVWAVKPGTRKCGIEKYTGVKFAHRGLHGAGVAENSMTAFRLAKEAGFGIELDVRLSRGGDLVVFHDPTLSRVCGVDALVSDCSLDELRRVRLLGTDDCVPTLREVLDLIDGAVPLLIEIKMEGEERGIAEALAEEIADYTGDYIVESFNPIALRITRRLLPKVPRGILSSRFTKEEKYRKKPLYFILENLLLNFLHRPDFIAYEKGGSAAFPLRFIRKRWSTPLFAWTVRSPEEELKTVSDGFDTVIFEGYAAKK